MSAFWSAIIPIIVALLTIGGGVLGYVRQKAADRHSELVRVQQEYYRAYLFVMQRVLTACVRSDHAARRTAIDDFRSFEAALYVTAPVEVAKNLAKVHIAFVNYTRCIRCKYEEGHYSKYGKSFPPEKLREFEEAFLNEYRNILRSMRHHTVRNGEDIPIEISLATKEAHS